MIPGYSNRSKEKILTTINDVKLWVTRDLHKSGIRKLSNKSPHYYKNYGDGYKEHINYWKSHGFRNVDKRWYLHYCGCSGICDEKYVPEDIYYTRIEPNLNNQQLSLAYADKNLYEKLYDPDLFPHTVMRSINGIYYDRFYNLLSKKFILNHIKGLNEGRYILKPSVDSGGGKNVQSITITGSSILDENGNQLHLKEINREYNGNFLIQHKIEQNDFLAQFNSTSVNSIRIMTYYSEYSDQVYMLKSGMRMGRNNSTLDNEKAGGISCGVDINGNLTSFALDKHASKYFEHPSSGVIFKGKVIPQYPKMIDIANEIHKTNPHHRILGFDFSMDKEGNPIIIEINNRNLGICALQSFGGSLFGDLSDEIIEISKENLNMSQLLWR